MKKVAVMLAALSLSCASSGSSSYTDACQTARKICSLADLVCVFAPKGILIPMDKAAKMQKLREIDSLAIILREQLNHLEDQ